MLRTFMPVLGLIALVASVGLAHGLLTDRWGASASLQRAVTALDRFPKAVGDWVGADDTRYDPEDMARAGIRGHVGRSYRNSRTGETVQVLVVCGRGGPISVHTPDVCYVASGFRTVGGVQLMPDPPAGASFWEGRFAKPDAIVPQHLDIYWAWSRAGADWAAPASPRAAFAWAPALYKLYVVRASAGPAGNGSDARVREFLTALLPQLKLSLAQPE